MQFFENETESDCIERLTIENRLDKVAIYGELEITKDRIGLIKAKKIIDLMVEIVSALEKQESLPDEIVCLPSELVENPFEN